MLLLQVHFLLLFPLFTSCQPRIPTLACPPIPPWGIDACCTLSTGLAATVSPHGCKTSFRSQLKVTSAGRSSQARYLEQHPPSNLCLLHIAVLIALLTSDSLLSPLRGISFTKTGILFAWSFHFIPSDCNSPQHMIDIQ